MNEQYVAVRLIHDYILNRPPSMDSLDNRIIAQKVIYLASSLGVECGDFEFNWYKRGPYSPALTRVLYDNDVNENIISRFRLKTEAEEIIKPLKEMILDKVNDMNDVDWVELLASTHFLSKKNWDVNDMAKELTLLKPKYSMGDALYAKECLDKYKI